MKSDSHLGMWRLSAESVRVPRKEVTTPRDMLAKRASASNLCSKAADVVWVSSGPYSFKFDKSKQLGMIAPIWDTFPAEVKPGFTSLYLQLSDAYDRRGLLNELRSLDSRLLIFLRRLQNITVCISEPLRKTWKSSFSKVQIGTDLIRLVDNNKPCDYIVTRHQVSNMPYEPKREGVSSSEIVLGFPITEHHQPRRQSQQAYAFLPIRDY